MSTAEIIFVASNVLVFLSYAIIVWFLFRLGQFGGSTWAELPPSQRILVGIMLSLDAMRSLLFAISIFTDDLTLLTLRVLVHFALATFAVIVAWTFIQRAQARRMWRQHSHE